MKTKEQLEKEIEVNSEYLQLFKSAEALQRVFDTLKNGGTFDSTTKEFEPNAVRYWSGYEFTVSWELASVLRNLNRFLELNEEQYITLQIDGETLAKAIHRTIQKSIDKEKINE